MKYNGFSGVKYSPSLLATSPTHTHSGTSPCRCMMD